MALRLNSRRSMRATNSMAAVSTIESDSMYEDIDMDEADYDQIDDESVSPATGHQDTEVELPVNLQVTHADHANHVQATQEHATNDQPGHVNTAVNNLSEQEHRPLPPTAHSHLDLAHVLTRLSG